MLCVDLQEMKKSRFWIFSHFSFLCWLGELCAARIVACSRIITKKLLDTVRCGLTIFIPDNIVTISVTWTPDTHLFMFNKTVDSNVFTLEQWGQVVIIWYLSLNWYRYSLRQSESIKQVSDQCMIMCGQVWSWDVVSETVSAQLCSAGVTTPRRPGPETTLHCMWRLELLPVPDNIQWFRVHHWLAWMIDVWSWGHHLQCLGFWFAKPKSKDKTWT